MRLEAEIFHREAYCFWRLESIVSRKINHAFDVVLVPGGKPNPTGPES